ncbi:MAG TPA: hypothetical protein VIG66_06790, partial [Noviherbaspirillum sp.]
MVKFASYGNQPVFTRKFKEAVADARASKDAGVTGVLRYEPGTDQSIRLFEANTERFAAFKKDYRDLLDRIHAFVKNNADKDDPPLTETTVAAIKENLDRFYSNMFEEDYFP